MLKLEKISKSVEIGITLRQRETFFTRNLLQAFTIAVGLHVVAALCFQVHLFKILGNQSVFPPIFVDADISLQSEGQVMAQIDQREAFPLAIKEPSRSSLKLPPLPGGEIHRPPIIHHPVPSPVDLFATLNHDIYPLDFMGAKGVKRNVLPVQIHISGPLSEKKMIVKSTQNLPQVTQDSPYRVVYHVQIDDTTGAIFWYELKDKQEKMPGEAEARKILQALRFQTSEDSFVTAGEIEINFNQGMRKDD